MEGNIIKQSEIIKGNSNIVGKVLTKNNHKLEMLQIHPIIQEKLSN